MVGIFHAQWKIKGSLKALKLEKDLGINSWLKTPFLDPSHLWITKPPIFVHVPKQLASRFIY
jgi:hypothetical protein